MSDDIVGRSCGGYRIVHLLGEGGMGQVYLGFNEHLGKKAAIKVLLPTHSKRMLVEIRFLQEARAAAQIDDPNIIDILDAAQFPDGRFYIVMPFIDGESLDALCERMGPLPIDATAEILLQICGGLDSAHRHGIVHRDIKPQNIMISRRQQRQYFSTIVDFGIVKVLDPEVAGVHTESKAMMGTPGYMAPEQARGIRDIDARTDVYAVGIVAYKMLTGRRPYMDETLYGLIEKQIMNAPFPGPRELRPNVPVQWEQAILAALTPDRDHRLPSVREFAQLIARGLPRGDQLVRTLVPHLAGLALPPDAVPVSGMIGSGSSSGRLPAHAAATLGSYSQSPQRRRQALRGTVVALAAAALGSAVTYGSMVAPATPATVATVTPHSLAPAANVVAAPASVVAALPTGAADSTATVSAPVAKVPTAGTSAPRAAVPVTSAVDKPATMSASPDDPEPARNPLVIGAKSRSAAGPSPASVAGVSSPKDRGKDDARVGWVVIRVKSWAEVFINDQRVGYAPVRRELPVGSYRLILKNDNEHEETTLTVVAGRDTIIGRNW